MIPQTTLFTWENDIENLGDNERLVHVLENLPDEPLMQKLEKGRGRGRNDYPVRAMWNMVIAMIVFGHGRFADIIREMKRNVQLRYICGFRNGKTPNADNVSRFISKLMGHIEDLLGIFCALSDMLYVLLPDFGESLAIDSKWVWSLANRKSKSEDPDGRSETDAEWGSKVYSGVDENGVAWSSKKKCFGFKIHVLTDVKYELPVAFIVTPANSSDIVCGKELIEEIADDKSRIHILERCRYLMADRGYDDEKFIGMLTGYGIKAVIDKRNLWKDETEKEVPGSDCRRYYDEHGNVYCYSPEMGERHRMAPVGYDSDRDAQRFKCPVTYYGAECKESDTCRLAKTIRVPLETDRRIFTEVGRTTYKWGRLYAGRTAVERVNSRLDVSFGFEERRVRGKKKMNLMTALAFAVMDALAVSSIKENKPERMRSLVRAA
jgi:transposase